MPIIRTLSRAAASSALLLAFVLAAAPAAHSAPYVSCPGGYVAPALRGCPNIPQNRGGARKPAPIGGGGGGGGLLGGLLGSLGLGGLGGLL